MRRVRSRGTKVLGLRCVSLRLRATYQGRPGTRQAYRAIVEPTVSLRSAMGKNGRRSLCEEAANIAVG